MSTVGPRHRLTAEGLDPGFVFLAAFVLVLLLEPSAAVLPGPLRSNGSPAVILALLAFAVVVLNFVSTRRQEFAANGPALLAIVASLEFSTWVQGYIRPHDAIVGASVTRGLLAVAGYTGIGMLAMFCLQNTRKRARLFAVMVAALSFDGIVGILQNVTRRDERFLFLPPGFVLNSGYVQAVRDGHPRATGTAGSPIEYAVLMAVLVALSLYLLHNSHARNTRLLGAIGVTVGLVGVPASVSRTGVVGLAGVAIVYLIFVRLRNFAGVLLGLTLVVGVFVLAVPRLSRQLTDLFSNASSDDSITGRTSDYAVVFGQFHVHPWFGTGLGSNPAYQTRFLDNQWLQAIVEGGFVGVVALAVLFTAAFAGSFGSIRESRSLGERREALALLAATTAVFASSFTFDLFGFNQAKYVFFLIFGSSWAAVVEHRLGAASAAQVRPSVVGTR